MANKIIKYNEVELVLKTYANTRVLTSMDLSKIYDKRIEIKCNKRKTFKEGKDYFRLPSEVFKIYGDNPNYNYPHGGYLITESGYLKMFPKDQIAKYICDHYYHDYIPPVEKKKEVTTISSSILHNERDISSDNITHIDFYKQILIAIDSQIKISNEILTEIKNIKEKIYGNNDEYRFNINSNRNCSNNEVDRQITYEEYKKEISEIANKILTTNSKYKGTNDVLSEAYKRLRNQYGTVYEQERKEFTNVEGRVPISTLELQWWIENNKPVYKDMLIGKLNTMLREK